MLDVQRRAFIEAEQLPDDDQERLAAAINDLIWDELLARPETEILLD
jgi:hypothetical protein